MAKIGNTFGRLFAITDDNEERVVELLRHVYETAPPFGSPENLAQLDSAEREGRQFEMLVMLPTGTLPN